MRDIHEAEALILLRRYLGGMGTGAGGETEGRLRDLLPAVEPMVWRSHGEPQGVGWRRLLAAIRTELAAYRTTARRPERDLHDVAASAWGRRVVHVPDVAFEYPVGTRIDVVGAVGSDAVDVEPSPFGRYRVVVSERAHLHGRNIATLTLQPVR